MREMENAAGRETKLLTASFVLWSVRESMFVGLSRHLVLDFGIVSSSRQCAHKARRHFFRVLCKRETRRSLHDI